MNSNNQHKMLFRPSSLAWLLLLVAVPAIAIETSNTSTKPALCPETEVNQLAKSDREAIEKVMADWEAVVQAVDLTKLGSLVTVDAEFWTHGAEPLVGRDALVEVFETFLAKYEMHQKYDCQELIINGEWAFIRGLEVNELKDRETGEVRISKQRAFSVLTKSDDGQWRFARGMTHRPPED